MRFRLSPKLQNSLSVVLIGCFGLLATGCSLGGGNDTDTTAAEQPVMLRVWRMGQDVDSIRKALVDFKKAHPRVVPSYVKNEPEDYEIRSLKSMAGRKGPDIWSIRSDWLGDYEDQIQPLPDDYFYTVDKDGKVLEKITPTEAVKKLYPTGIAEQITRTDGKVYGVPANVDTLHLYYNPNLFRDASNEYNDSVKEIRATDEIRALQKLLASPPQTWNDLVTQTRYLTKRNGSAITRSAIALGSSNNIPEPEDTLQLLMVQNGAKIVSSDRKNVLFHIKETSPSGSLIRPGEKALDFFSSFANPSKSTYSWNPSMPQAIDAFAQGKVAMVISYTDFGEQLKIKYPNFRFEVTGVPQISTSTTQEPVNFMRFSVETVTQTADNSAAAFAFLKIYTDKNGATSLASEQRLQTPFLEKLNTNSKDPSITQIFTAKTTFKYHHTQFDAVLRQMITDVAQNGVPVGQALDGAAEKANALLVPDNE